MSLTVSAKELVMLKNRFDSASANYKKKKRGVLARIGAKIRKRAKVLCLESPTKADYEEMGINADKIVITSGNLRDSITMDLEGDDKVSVNIPVGSKGAEYAVKIHDRRFREWKYLGFRSARKRATDKFIFFAYEDEKKNVDKEIDSLVDDFIRGIL